MNDQDRVYLAGLFDGDGSIGIYENTKGSGRYTPSLAISTNVEWFADYLNEKTGLTKSSEVNNRGKSYEGIIYRLRTYKKDKIRWFFGLILPFVILKKEQIELALRYLDKEVSGEEACRALKRLKCSQCFNMDSN